MKISEAYKRIIDPDSFRDEDDNHDEEDDNYEEEMMAMFADVFGEMFGGATTFDPRGRGFFKMSPQMFVMMEMMLGEDFDDENDGEYEDDEEEYYQSGFIPGALDPRMIDAMMDAMGEGDYDDEYDEADEEYFDDAAIDELAFIQSLLMGGGAGKNISTRERREMDRIMAHLGLGKGSAASTKSKRQPLRQNKKNSKPEKSKKNGKKKSPSRSGSASTVNEKLDESAASAAATAGSSQTHDNGWSAKTSTENSAATASSKISNTSSSAKPTKKSKDKDDYDEDDWETDSSEDMRRAKSMKRSAGQILPTFPSGIPIEPVEVNKSPAPAAPQQLSQQQTNNNTKAARSQRDKVIHDIYAREVAGNARIKPTAEKPKFLVGEKVIIQSRYVSRRSPLVIHTYTVADDMIDEQAHGRGRICRNCSLCQRNLCWCDHG